MSIFEKIGDAKEAGELWGMTAINVKRLAQEGSIVAKKIGNSWAIDLTQPNPKKYGLRDYAKYPNIDEALEAYNNFDGKASISIDFADNELITDVHQMRDYEVATIVTACFKDDSPGNYLISKAKLFDLLEAMSVKWYSGWTKEDFEMYGVSEFAKFFK